MFTIVHQLHLGHPSDHAANMCSFPGCDDPLIRKAWSHCRPEPMDGDHGGTNGGSAFPYVTAMLRRMEGCRQHPMKVLMLGALVGIFWGFF